MAQVRLIVLRADGLRRATNPDKVRAQITKLAAEADVANQLPIDGATTMDDIIERLRTEFGTDAEIRFPQIPNGYPTSEPISSTPAMFHSANRTPIYVVAVDADESGSIDGASSVHSSVRKHTPPTPLSIPSSSVPSPDPPPLPMVVPAPLVAAPLPPLPQRRHPDIVRAKRRPVLHPVNTTHVSDAAVARAITFSEQQEDALRRGPVQTEEGQVEGRHEEEGAKGEEEEEDVGKEEEYDASSVSSSISLF